MRLLSRPFVRRTLLATGMASLLAGALLQAQEPPESVAIGDGTKPGEGQSGGFSHRTGTMGGAGRWASVGRSTGEMPRFPGISAPNRAMLIYFSDLAPQKQAQLQEDLAIMSHVLDKALDEFGASTSQEQSAMGILLAPGSGGIHNLYLEGYGALFTLNVNLALVAPPPPSQSEKNAPSPDSAWEEAKRELYGEPARAPASSAPWQVYSEEKVNRLKNGVLEALKNGSNIRDLTPEDSITVCIFGRSPTELGWQRWQDEKSRVPVLGDVPVMGRLFRSTGGRPAAASILTIRVKKADVDAFSQGKLTPDEFRQKAQTAAYVTEVGGGGNDNRALGFDWYLGNSMMNNGSTVGPGGTGGGGVGGYGGYGGIGGYGGKP